MLEVYCDSSFNEKGVSFIGCVVIQNGVEVFQSTTRIMPDPLRNLECELAAIEFAAAVAALFPDAATTIYNDSTEAVREYRARKPAGFTVEYMAREAPFQSLADRLAKKFPQALLETYGLCKKPVETFTADVLADIAGGRAVLYLKKNERETTNTKTVYTLIIRTIDRVISDRARYEARAGEVKNIKVARDVSKDLGGPGYAHREELDGAYFLLTDETWGLRLRGGEAYSILPCGILHRVICHEVDRSPDYLFERAGLLR